MKAATLSCFVFGVVGAWPPRSCALAAGWQPAAVVGLTPGIPSTGQSMREMVPRFADGIISGSPNGAACP